MEFFGNAIWEAMNESAVGNTRKTGPHNLLELLPDEFTLQDAVRLRQAEGMDAAGTKAMLYQWVHRNYLTVLTDDSYKKLKYRKDGVDLTKNSKG